ncbi:MAG: tetratricopeptide repeat protein [Cyanobacteria bacterium RUI128]|nr:tetratricopeptide repeat protein [Cyanobacteria bacterium RUI128]
MIDTKLLSQANLLIKKNEFTAAEKIYLEILAKNPNNDIVQAFLGRLYIKQKKYKGAERILEKAYDKRKTAPTVAALAFCKYKLRKFDESVILYEELFKYDKDSAKIFERIIQAFNELKMYNFAHAYALKFYEKHPDMESSLIRLTQSCIDIGNIKEAETTCAKAIQLFPKSSALWIIAGTLQEFTDCNEELAQECYITAIENGSKSAYYHLAVSYQKVGRFDDAERCYKKHMEYAPQDVHEQASFGTLYLTKKDLENGYKYFMKRDPAPDLEGVNKEVWDGSDRPEGTLMLYCDQGYGDHIQYMRYLPFLTDKFKTVKVVARENCLDIFKRSYPKNKYPMIEFYGSIGEVGDYDTYVPTTDLPYFLKIDFNHIPFSDGYLVFDEDKKEYFNKKYFQTDKLKVGLCWKAGGVGMRSAINRTINIDYFKKLFELENVQFYSFQLDDIFDATEKYPQITDLKSELQTFDDTASALVNLDLMISVDTSCLHLAGALGVKSYLLIPYCSDWRWFENTETTEWYSSVRILKQQDRVHWFAEMDKLYEKLKEFTENGL